MPRYDVKHKDKWACFSSIVDGFLTIFMEKSDYEIWRIRQYGSGYRPIEQCNIITMREAISSIRIHNTHEETLEQLIGCGVEDAETLLYDVETENYCPIKTESGFKCPNCGIDVERGQISCREETCEIVFVWRD